MADLNLVKLLKMPGHLIRRMQQISTAIFTEELKGIDLTSVQWAALHAISERQDLDATRLAETIFFDRATIGGVIERLELKGLISRNMSESDRRIKVLNITEKGKNLISDCDNIVLGVQNKILAPLNDDEKATFLLLIDKIVNGRG